MSSDEAQPQWASQSVGRRLQVIKRFRHLLAEHGQQWVKTLTQANPTRTHEAQTLSAELIPLAAAARFLERRATKLLAAHSPGPRAKPLWLADVRAQVRRQPLGVVLIIGPTNYPLFIPGVQVVQALTAGNRVILKPGRFGAAASQMLSQLLVEAGLDPALITVLDESPQSASQAIEAGVDKVVLTGSPTTGRAILRQCAEHLTPVTVELSGADSVYVLPGADLSMTARAIGFGMRLNGGATCIAPRRIFLLGHDAAPQRHFERQLVHRFNAAGHLPVEPAAADRAQALIDQSVEAGGRRASGERVDAQTLTPTLVTDPPHDADLLRSDVFAPVCSLLTMDDVQSARDLDRTCPYALGASIFGPPRDAACLAPRLRAGSVCINDLIAPTADPRLSFGGRDESGFGVSRGEQGLLEMTVSQTITQRRGRFRPHYDPPGEWDTTLLLDYLRASHAKGLAQRGRGWGRMLHSARQWFNAKRGDG